MSEGFVRISYILFLSLILISLSGCNLAEEVGGAALPDSFTGTLRQGNQLNEINLHDLGIFRVFIKKNTRVATTEDGKRVYYDEHSRQYLKESYFIITSICDWMKEKEGKITFYIIASGIILRLLFQNSGKFRKWTVTFLMIGMPLCYQFLLYGICFVADYMIR